jgi:acetyl esterase/lipase
MRAQNKVRMTLRKWIFTTLLAGLALGNTGCDNGNDNNDSGTTKEFHSYSHLTVDSTFNDIRNHPAFDGFGLYMLPSQNEQNAQGFGPLTVKTLAPLIDPGWDPQTIVDGLNFMIDLVNAGETIFYPLYSKDEIAADESKDATGLFFVAGDPHKPLAVLVPGGAFKAVASIQEGFPIAKALHEQGYNVAILKYRVMSFLFANDQPTAEQRETEVNQAHEDMASVMKVLRDNSKKWGFTLDDYSVWGFSAGGVLASGWAANDPTGAKAQGFDLPAMVMNAYTPSGDIVATPSLPPYFVTDAADDEQVSPAGVADFVERLKAQGVEVEYLRFDSGKHGFGLGVGTAAYGWLNQAVAFWNAHPQGCCTQP